MPRGRWGAAPGGVGLPPLSGASGVRRCPSPGRLPSGAGSRGSAIRPVCPGCSRCGRGDPAPVPQRAPLRARVARCGGGGRASPGVWLSPLRGASEVRRSPSPGCPPLPGRAVGVRHLRAVGTGVRVWGPGTVPSACMPCGGCVLRGWWGAVPGGVVCHRCEGRLVSGAVPPPAARPLGRAAGVLRPVCPGCGRCGRGDPAPAPQRAPLRASVARCGGGGGVSPGGGAFHRCEGRLRSGARPPQTARPPGGLSGSATHVPWARACGCGGPALFPWPARPVGAACRGGGGGPSPGGVACHRCEGRLVSLPRPPVLWGGQPGFRNPCAPGAVGAGVGTQHRPHSVHPCGPALLAVGVAEGRPQGGCLPPL